MVYVLDPNNCYNKRGCGVCDNQTYHRCITLNVYAWSYEILFFNKGKGSSPCKCTVEERRKMAEDFATFFMKTSTFITYKKVIKGAIFRKVESKMNL